MTEWNFVKQTKAQTFTEANTYFHGFVFYIKPPRLVTLDGRIIDSALDEAIASARRLTTTEEIGFIKEFLEKTAPLDEITPKGKIEYDTIVKRDSIMKTYTRYKWTGKYLPRSKRKRAKGKRYRRKSIWNRPMERVKVPKSKLTYRERVFVIERGDSIALSKIEEGTMSTLDYTSGIRSLREVGSDSLVYKILMRNKFSDNVVVVEDVTGSMYPYLMQTFLYRRLQMSKKKITSFVFFNDGDRKPDGPIGKSGGAYFVDSENIKDIEETAFRTMAKGGGGAAPENNIEAALFAISKKKDCKEIVMIVDNWANVRDKKILKKLKKTKIPLRIIVCGVSNGIINIDYIELARATNGSLHTLEEDFMELAKLAEGETFIIGKQEFIIKGGKVLFLKRV